LVAEQHGRVDEAEQWFRKSLEIVEVSDDRLALIEAYSSMGLVAQRRGHLNEAEQWYVNGLTISEGIGNRLYTGMMYSLLGILADRRGRTDDALEWIIQSLTIVNEFTHSGMRAQREFLARVARKFGMEALEQCWLRVTKTELPAEVRTFVETFEEDRG
jgi:tetratricopeptide (TPR) repeat protein